jgi:hypothetical protein
MALVLSPPSACALEIMRQLTRLPDELTYNPVFLEHGPGLTANVNPRVPSGDKTYREVSV